MGDRPKVPDGWVVLRESSYKRAQERQRMAEVLRRYAEEDAERARAWARSVCEEERYLRDRCTFLYGVAAAHGATEDELRGFFDHASWTAARTSPNAATTASDGTEGGAS